MKKNIILLGPGNVGRSFLKQAIEAEKKGAPIEIVAVADSKTILYQKNSFSALEIDSICQQKESKAPLYALSQFEEISSLSSILNEKSILVDASATEKTIPLLIEAIDKGAGIVLANKIPLTADKKNAHKLLCSSRLRYEATVGAGLPVIASLKRILVAGDEVNEIFGLVSGTLGFVCSQMDEGKKYADIIRDAHQLGYTEPDPRDDLGGIDAARKAIILARTCGWNLSMDDIRIEPLFNTKHASLAVNDFMNILNEDNEHYEILSNLAMSKNEALRYLIYVNANGAQAKLQSVPKTSAFGSLKGTENRVEFHSKNFSNPPLAICGAGAGAENTALGILADVLSLL